MSSIQEVNRGGQAGAIIFPAVAEIGVCGHNRIVVDQEKSSGGISEFGHGLVGAAHTGHMEPLAGACRSDTHLAVLIDHHSGQVGGCVKEGQSLVS